MKDSIIVFICYARSGGTLFNKYLNSIGDYLVLSEISPRVGIEKVSTHPGLRRLTPSWQMRNWHGFNMESSRFIDQIEEVNIYSKSLGKYLVIRDWSYINFNYDEKLPEHIPKNNFEIISVLSQKFDVKVVGLIRNAVDVWISMGRPDISNFIKSYGLFIEELNSLTKDIIKFEDFTSDPRTSLGPVSHIIDVSKIKNKVDISSQTFVNGDISVNDSYRSAKGIISRMSRKPILPWEFVEFIRNKKAIERVNKVNNYNTDYFDDYSFSSYTTDLLRKISLKLKKSK